MPKTLNSSGVVKVGFILVILNYDLEGNFNMQMY